MIDSAHLNLVDINPLVLLLHLLVCDAHRVDGRHRVLQVLGRHGRLLHVEGLLLELVELVLVHPFLFEGAEGALLDGVLVLVERRRWD